jgi:hypothetical protein
MQNNGQQRIGPNDLSVHLNVVAFARLCAKVGARPAVDRDAAGRDQVVAVTAGTYAGRSEKTIQTHTVG